MTEHATVEPRRYAPDDLIEVADWGADHWSTLAYAETVMVDCAGFQVGADARMRANRRHFRLMADMVEGCRKPKRTGGASWQMAVVMEPKHTSRLRNGAVSENHDDWCCIQDLAAAGVFSDGTSPVGQDAVEPGVVLHLSDLGRKLATELREFKAAGGRFGDFVPSPALAGELEANLAKSLGPTPTA